MLQAKISTAEVCFVFVTTGIVLFFMRQLFGTKYFCRIYEEMPFTDFFQRNYGFKYYEFVKFYGIGPWTVKLFRCSAAKIPVANLIKQFTLVIYESRVAIFQSGATLET